MKVISAGYGNLFSVSKALEKAGAVLVKEDGDGEDALVLPGVGAFDTGAKAIQGLVLGGKPFLGICLGMQLLFEGSEEGSLKGIGLLDGKVRRMKAEKLPHLGWNTVSFEDSLLGEGLQDEWFYFVHSYACPKSECVKGWTEYGQKFPAVVEKGNVFGVQFHPEKSGSAGIKLLENFVEAVRQWK
ncbi:imidazole glycerol phosphate synthase subunit HisH [Candidatus Micrarchaeota archaeon]|nr:imidazole glycerol phosphate synthase subunit HisH [Candidatus Micrarchaeota archaeon]